MLKHHNTVNLHNKNVLYHCDDIKQRSKSLTVESVMVSLLMFTYLNYIIII